MRIATWNIRAGGGRRVEQIANVIHEEMPDLLVLTEFRSGPGEKLLEHLVPLSYEVVGGAATQAQNCVSILSRWPLVALSSSKQPTSQHRWVHVLAPALDLVVVGVHVPNQTEIWNKRDFLGCLEHFAFDQSAGKVLIIGDLNTAFDEDCEGEKIREAVVLKRLLQAGWVDAWRNCNPAAREFTWYSHKKNGFRLDQCLLSPLLSNCLVSATIRHDVRTKWFSDHSYLGLELDMVCKQTSG